MKNRFSQKSVSGFTLIELLVVIAIISVLSSVVLTALDSSRNRGTDSTIKSSLNEMRKEADLNYDESTGYRQVCIKGKMSQLLEAAKTVAGGSDPKGNCESPNGGLVWAAWATLKTDNTKAWCVDSTGISEQIDKPSGLGHITAC